MSRSANSLFSLKLLRSSLALCILGSTGVAASAQGLNIGAYHLQSSTRVSATQYDYRYKADVLDASAGAFTSVVGTVASSSSSTVVIQGAVNFGPVGPNGSVTSTDTFTIRQDRRFAFSASDLAWTFQGTPALPAGEVTNTSNPQVAKYTVNLPAPGSVMVRFGTTTSYGHLTSPLSASKAGPITLLVAGMLPNTTYHMQATVEFSNGSSAQDVDHTFGVGAPLISTPLTVTTSPGMTPQPGLEQLTAIGNTTGLLVTDLDGNIIWTYALDASDQGQIQGAQLLQNGHYLVTVGQDSNIALRGPAPSGSTQAIREIDLAGNTIRQLTVQTLSSRLQSLGYNLSLTQFHHALLPLSNGHTLVLSNVLKAFADLPGFPGVTNVLGDVVVDLDENFQPVWVWNEFDHLDVNRHPFLFPDWTHTNAIVYSPTDHNLIISIRHQNWVVKVDYNDGQGTGSVLWHLGYQGDFTLLNGTDPSDWNYAQHYPSLFTPNSAGVFSLGLMDNGDDRVFPTGVSCGAPGAPTCLYTTIPVYEIDESAKTAKLTFHQMLPANLYSNFGGNTEPLENGNIEYDLAGSIAPQGSDIFEVTSSPANPQTVWHLQSPQTYLYRGYRIPSLYPGVPY